MDHKIFKFGGASVRDAGGVRNVASILRRYAETPLVVVVSAMGKTTNALEDLLGYYMTNDPLGVVAAFERVTVYHQAILSDLFPNPGHPVHGEVESLFNQLRGYIRKGHLFMKDRPGYDHEYDQVVSYGELVSSSILYHHLIDEGFDTCLFDVREIIRTDATHRDARVNWETTRTLVNGSIGSCLREKQHKGSIALTQGFLGGDGTGLTTTLGREGSDYTAAILAWCLGSASMTIWKDVPGVMNADPRWMDDAVTLDTLSYREAIELAYYGAGVIHPKTIQPLENADITLAVKSFVNPDLPGTTIRNLREWNIAIPLFIRKRDQMLISLSSRDFSFIIEEHLSQIFRILADYRVTVNLMHNSAISFSFCIGNDRRKTEPLLRFLSGIYETRYNEGLELFTIRHYDNQAIRRVTGNREVLMEIRSRSTVQLVVR